jgi:hypothetical protein
LANTNGAQTKVVTQGNPFFPEALLLGTGSASDLLPGWTVSVGDVQTDTVAINSGFYDSELSGHPIPAHAALLIDGNYLSSLFILSEPDGRFGLMLDNSRRFETPANVSVLQTGDIPPDARWLSWRLLTLSSPTIVVDGSSYLTFDLPRDPEDSTKVLFDISPWAGSTVTLGFGTSGDNNYAIDSIAFVVPEPGTTALLSLGAVGFLIAALRRRLR